MQNDENYPRSKGLFLSLPHRQTMVLSTDNTIRELCSSTTPTSQFSSLHFIASTAIGEKSIETRAQTLYRHRLKETCELGQLRQIANASHADGRFGAHWQPAASASFQYTRPSRRWLFDCLSGVRGAGHHASRSGGWRLNTHLSRYLIVMLWGPTPHCESPS